MANQHNKKDLGCNKDTHHRHAEMPPTADTFKIYDKLSKTKANQLQNDFMSDSNMRQSPLRKQHSFLSTRTSQAHQYPHCGSQDPYYCFLSRIYHLPPPPPSTPTRPPILNHTRGSDIVSPPLPRRVTRQQSRLKPYHYRIPTQSIHQHPDIPCPMRVGHEKLGIYRLRLPMHLMHLLDIIVLKCEAHAATLPHGWWTDLYSLTKQDIALPEVPEALSAGKVITSYIKKWMMRLWGVSSLYLDRNQPHVVKYDQGHVGVELHHDKCDITANLCLSRNTSYEGGG